MPPTRKPPDRRQARNRPQKLEVVERLRLPAPSAPSGWLKLTANRWESFWSSDVSVIVDRASDMPALRRLFDLYDERERSGRVFRRERLTTGSMDQVVLHPLGRHIAELDQAITRLEDRFGLTPRARLSLGLQVGAVAQTLDRMNAAFGGPDQIVEIDDYE